MQRLDFKAMGCHMFAALDSDDSGASEALTQVPVWFEEWEASLSRFRAESELSALNRAAGRRVPVSETLWQALQESIRAARDSGGLVTPTVLDAVMAAGYDRSFEVIQSQPQIHGGGAHPAEDWAISHHVGDWQAIEMDARAHTVRLPTGMHLDFGGVAKGWAADQAARRFSEMAPALVDAGGDIAISAPRANGERWPIAVADPFKDEADLELLMIDQGGVATSGRDYRRWLRDAKWQHHIVDPRTGAPAETDILTATVIAPTVAQAETAAKALLILGSQAGLPWIETRGELAALAVLEDGRVLRSRKLDDYVWSESPAWPEDSVLVPGS